MTSLIQSIIFRLKLAQVVSIVFKKKNVQIYDLTKIIFQPNFLY